MYSKAIEKEYKCLVSAEEYQRLLAYYQNEYQEIEQINIYYLDEKENLRHHQAVLRQRFIADKNVLSFKILVNDELLEYEKTHGTLGDEDFLGLLADYGLYPPFKENSRLKTIRRLVDLPHAELCLDENHYNGFVDYEIEYELKDEDGSLAEFVVLLKKLDINYQANPLSKYQRTIESK